MDNLNDTEKFGQNFERGQSLTRFFSMLLLFIERQIYNRIAKRINFLLARVNDSKLEIVAPGNKGKNEDGNWRQIVDDNGDLIVQKRISGTWTTSETYHG